MLPFIVCYPFPPVFVLFFYSDLISVQNKMCFQNATRLKNAQFDVEYFSKLLKCLPVVSFSLFMLTSL